MCIRDRSPFALQNSAANSEKGPVAMATANFKNTTLPNTTAPEVDLAIVNQTTNNVTILLGSLDSNGNVLLTEPNSSPIAVGNTPVAIAAADLNSDGIADLAVVNQADNTVSIILSSANANATSVSYTHLDVYKRQEIRHEMKLLEDKADFFGAIADHLAFT